MSLIAALWVMTTVVVPSSMLVARQRFEHAHTGPAVERAGRLVTEQHLGTLGDGAGDGDALLLAARKLGRKMIHPRGKTDPVERFFRRHRRQAISVTNATFSRAVSDGTRL